MDGGRRLPMDRVRRRRCIDVGVGLATRVTAKRGHALGGAAAQARVAHLESGRGTWSADHRLRLNLHALHRRRAHSGRARASSRKGRALRHEIVNEIVGKGHPPLSGRRQRRLEQRSALAEVRVAGPHECVLAIEDAPRVGALRVDG